MNSIVRQESFSSRSCSHISWVLEDDVFINSPLYVEESIPLYIEKSSPLYIEESIPWLFEKNKGNILNSSLENYFYYLSNYFLPLDICSEVKIELFGQERSREEIVIFLEGKDIYFDKSSKKFLFSLDPIFFIKLVNLLSIIRKNFDNKLILTSFEDDGYEMLLLLVCFEDEDFEIVDQIMDRIYEIIEDSKLDFISATEKFECQTSTGKTF